MFCTFRSNADPEYGRDFDLKPETEEEKERFVLRLCSSCEEEGKVQQALAKCKVDPQTFSFSIIQCCSVIKFYISFTVGPIQLITLRGLVSEDPRIGFLQELKVQEGAGTILPKTD